MPVRVLRSVLSALALMAATAVAPAGWAGGFDPPVGAKFSPEKLERAGDFLKAEIAAGNIPGAILLLQQHGKPIYDRKLGVRDKASGLPMSDDTIFRLHSMTKPITSFAAMMLIDQGKLGLDDPVSKYIPAFAAAKVGVDRTKGKGEKLLAFEPLRRPITIRDLMKHTSGITYGFYGEGLVRNLYGNAAIYDDHFETAEFVASLAALPLAEQPETLWG